MTNDVIKITDVININYSVLGQHKIKVKLRINNWLAIKKIKINFLVYYPLLHNNNQVY
jgi:hypothetical protein